MPKIREGIREDEVVRDAVRPDEEPRRRLRKGSQVVEPFHIPPELIPHGWSLNWKNHDVKGEVDYNKNVYMHEQGWRPVDHSHFPGRFAPVGTTGAIIKDGMILMERPIELTEEAEREDYKRARDAVRVGERRLTETSEGEAERSKPTIGRSVEPPLQIPE